jgi:hypothetical protein
MDRQIILPTYVGRKGNNRAEAIGGESGYPDGSNSFIANSFVVLTNGELVSVATDGVLACGLVLDESKSATTVDPPYEIFGDRHWPLALSGCIFAVSVTDDSENIGEANSAPQLSEIAIGSSYGIKKGADGTHYLNVDETSTTLFTVLEKPESWNGVEQDADTYNPVVLVEVIPSKIQLVG